MKYEKDIRVRTQKFAVQIVKEVVALRRDGVEYALRDQLLRSGCSIGANVREGKASSSRKELIRYYEIALKSAGETDFWLQTLRDGYEFHEEKFKNISNELEEISKVITAIIINLKKEL